MSIESLLNEATAFVKTHEAWAPLIVGLLAFGESFAVISLFVPATFALVGIGALIGASGIQFFPCWAAAAIGASLGDWISYWIGLKLKETARHTWPLSRYPAMIARGEQFFLRWGVWSIFVGRFFGPVRAVIPLIAGTFGMPSVPFQIANVTSAMLWALVLLAPGFAALRIFQW
jgi:membrane protein DedA with SNARE-associated domain